MGIITTYNFLNKKFPAADFTDEWLASFGRPELRGLWFVWGRSGQGKTSFVIQLCKYLSGFGRGVYNSLEQGHSLSLQVAARRAGVEMTDKRIGWLNKAPLHELRDILSVHKSPKYVVIDSIQRSGYKYREFVDFMNEFPDKLFIVISQADKGGNPLKSVAESLWFDADVKIKVEGYTAYFNTRYENPETGEGGAPYTIWRDGADKYNAAALDR